MKGDLHGDQEGSAEEGGKNKTAFLYQCSKSTCTNKLGVHRRMPQVAAQVCLPDWRSKAKQLDAHA